MEQFQYKAISTNTTTVFAASGNITVHTVCFPKATAGTVTFQDAAAAAYITFPASTVAGTYRLDSVFGNGLSVVTASADNVVVTYKIPG